MKKSEKMYHVDQTHSRYEQATISPHLQSFRKKTNLGLLFIKRFLEYFISGKDLQDHDIQL